MQKQKKKLGRQAVLLLSVHGMFAAANTFSAVFVNVYLWKIKHDFALIGWFVLAGQALSAATFLAAGKWAKEGNKMNILRVGVAVSALFYLVILLLEKDAARFAVLLGVLQGTSLGLFWLAFNVVYFEITNPDNRDRFNGWAGFLGSAAGAVAPWAAGFLITKIDDKIGYRVIFAISLGIFLAAAIASFFLKKHKIAGKFNWRYVPDLLQDQRNQWRRVIPALAAQGVREGVFVFVIGLLVYVETKSELKLGNYSLITSAVSTFSYWYIGKKLRRKFRGAGMLFGTLAMIAVILPFFWKFNFAMLLLFGIGTALFYPLFAIPMTSSVFDLIGANEQSARHRVELIIMRELGLNAGRMLGTIGFIALVSVTRSPTAINFFLLAIGSAPVLSWFFLRNGLLGKRARVDNS
ncbi:MAG TPA: MFS transporter [Bacilli bacterium]